jgi:N-acetylglucosamine-6-phosphate deacetylase
MGAKNERRTRIRARHYATGEWIELLCGRRIESLTSPTLEDREAGEPILAADWVAPALFDLQVNGCDGRSFNAASLTVADVRHVVRVCRRHGISALCPTLVTASREALLHGFTTLRRACEEEREVAASVPGLHLEGPYICGEDGPRGAHPRQHVRPPDWDEFCRFQDAAGGRIRLVTLAPEQPGALPFIEKLTAAGVTVAIGHTAASGSRIHEAVHAGARLSTHLGNGSHAMLPRHDNYLWEELACDDLWASVIADGHHLPAAVLRCILRVKTPARTILTCDASSLAGLPVGRYREWGQEFEMQPGGKVVVVGTPYLGGSGVFTDACVSHAIAVGGVSLQDAFDMAGARPRQLLGLPPRELIPDAPADLVLFRGPQTGPLELVAVVLDGETVVAPVESAANR